MFDLYSSAVKGIGQGGPLSSFYNQYFSKLKSVGSEKYIHLTLTLSQGWTLSVVCSHISKFEHATFC